MSFGRDFAQALGAVSGALARGVASEQAQAQTDMMRRQIAAQDELDRMQPVFSGYIDANMGRGRPDAPPSAGLVPPTESRPVTVPPQPSPGATTAPPPAQPAATPESAGITDGAPLPSQPSRRGAVTATPLPPAQPAPSAPQPAPQPASQPAPQQGAPPPIEVSPQAAAVAQRVPQMAQPIQAPSDAVAAAFRVGAEMPVPLRDADPNTARMLADATRDPQGRVMTMDSYGQLLMRGHSLYLRAYGPAAATQFMATMEGARNFGFARTIGLAVAALDAGDVVGAARAANAAQAFMPDGFQTRFTPANGGVRVERIPESGGPPEVTTVPNRGLRDGLLMMLDPRWATEHIERVRQADRTYGLQAAQAGRAARTEARAEAREARQTDAGRASLDLTRARRELEAHEAEGVPGEAGMQQAWTERRAALRQRVDELRSAVEDRQAGLPFADQASFGAIRQRDAATTLAGERAEEAQRRNQAIQAYQEAVRSGDSAAIEQAGQILASVGIRAPQTQPPLPQRVLDRIADTVTAARDANRVQETYVLGGETIATRIAAPEFARANPGRGADEVVAAIGPILSGQARIEREGDAVYARVGGTVLRLPPYIAQLYASAPRRGQGAPAAPTAPTAQARPTAGTPVPDSAGIAGAGAPPNTPGTPTGGAFTPAWEAERQRILRENPGPQIPGWMRTLLPPPPGTADPGAWRGRDR